MRSLFFALLAACGMGDPPPTPAAEGRQVPVLISGSGYTPATIEAAPNESLTLVFERLDANNCGGEIVFPDTGRTVSIPVGAPVPVPVTAPAHGRLAFTCGMAMYEGQLVVSGG